MWEGMGLGCDATAVGSVISLDGSIMLVPM